MPPPKRPTDDDSSVLPRNKHPRLDDDDEDDDATVVVSDDDDDNDDATVDLCWVDSDEQDVAGVPVLRVVMSNKTPLGDTSRAAAVIARNPTADFICLVFKQGGGLPTDDGTLRRHTPSSHTLVHTTTDHDGTAVCGIFQRGCAWQWLGELVPYLYHMRHRRTGTDITIANVFFPRGQPASESEAGVQRLAALKADVLVGQLTGNSTFLVDRGYTPVTALSVWHQRLRTFVVESRTVHEDGTVSASLGVPYTMGDVELWEGLRVMQMRAVRGGPWLYHIGVGAIVHHGANHDRSPRDIMSAPMWVGSRETAMSYGSTVHRFRVTAPLTVLAMDFCESVRWIHSGTLPPDIQKKLVRSFECEEDSGDHAYRRGDFSRDRILVSHLCEKGVVHGYAHRWLRTKQLTKVGHHQHYPELVVCNANYYLEHVQTDQM